MPQILYQDSDIVVVAKPRGVLSEGGGAETMPALLAPLVGGVFAVHRLDRGVGGVMVYARTKSAAARLSAAVAAGELHKTYIAVVSGMPEPCEGEWRDFLFKDTAKNKSFVVDRARKGAREAILRYRVLDSIETEHGILSRVEINLLTGRSHQIRVQFASRGYPLVGDGKYGSRVKAPYPALHAEQLSFPHPKTGKKLHFLTPVPGDFPFDCFGKAGMEIEHKYLICYPDTAAFAAVEGARKKAMVQTYLTAAPGETRRVRRVTEGEKITYIYTRKVRVSALQALEEEKTLDKATYEALLNEADPTRNPIRKTRWCLPFAGQTVEVDIYPFWQDRAIAEVEVADAAETVTLPPYIRVLAEVTADKRYKNVNLAREIPSDPLPE